MLDVILHTITRHTDDVFIFRFIADAGQPGQASVLPPAPAGSHICIALPNGLRPSYSLIDTPSEAPLTYTIAVRLNADGRGASRYLCQSARPGDAFKTTAPADRFSFHEAAVKHVFIAGGIGITPLWSMIQRAEQIGAEWELYYANRCRSAAPFLDALDALAQRAAAPGKVTLAFSAEGSRLDVPGIVQNASRDAHVYCCGPQPMLAAFRAAATVRAPGTVHWEQFDGVQALATALPATAPLASSPIATVGFTVTLARSARSLHVPPDKSLLGVLLEHGIAVDYGCRQGTCGACETRVLEGQPLHRDFVLTEEEQAENRTMMICCSGSQSETLVLDL